MAIMESGVLQALIDILKAFTPTGVQPLLFYATFIISLGLLYVVLAMGVPYFKQHKGIAFITALVISYFVASSAFVTIIISKLFPNVGLALMAIIGVMMVIAFISPESLEGGMSWTPLIVIVTFAIVIYLTYAFAAPELQASGALAGVSFGGFAITNEDAAIIIIGIAVIVGIFALVRTPGGGSGKSVWDMLSKKTW
jgi:hypothetical protein